jgi:metal-responsive CopG/Arc/MetJ family transcriptional regulator
MATIKLSITLPKKVAEKVAIYSAKNKESTSKFITKILEENLQKIQRENLIKQINEVFSDEDIAKEQINFATRAVNQLPKQGFEW